MPRLGRMAVVGGGISGLASAYYLSRAGFEIHLFEESDQLGGLGTFFLFNNHHFERFYHCMLPSDRALLSLLSELNLATDVYWKETRFAYLAHGTLYGLNSAQELLKFAPLSVTDRVRVGLSALRARFVKSDLLDETTAEEWLTNVCGKAAFEKFWKPLLQAKFGELYPSVPMLWLWTRFHREKGKGPETKGYIRGGYKRIIDTLVDALRASGVTINLRSKIDKITLSDREEVAVHRQGEIDRFRSVVNCGPFPVTRKLLEECPEALSVLDCTQGVDYQGVINVVLLLNRSISGKYYWIAALDEHIPFQGIIESSVLIDASDRSGYHLVYLTCYTHRLSALFEESDLAIKERFISCLLKIAPSLGKDDIVESFIFRTPFVEPIYTTGYLRRKPPAEIVDGQIYSISTAQVYPEVTSWNGSVGLANDICQKIVIKHSNVL